jgi:hypothetical protein
LRNSDSTDALIFGGKAGRSRLRASNREIQISRAGLSRSNP